LADEEQAGGPLYTSAHITVSRDNATTVPAFVLFWLSHEPISLILMAFFMTKLEIPQC